MTKRGLIVVDLQNEYLSTGKLPLSGIEAASTNAARVIAHARSNGEPIFHVRHEFANNEAPFFLPGTEGVEIQSAVAPHDGEPVIVKNHINSFRQTDLKQQRKRLLNTPLTVLLMQQVATDAAAAQRSGCFSAWAGA
ncbi:isochorismatase family protein [Achromobacter marplatensis]